MRKTLLLPVLIGLLMLAPGMSHAQDDAGWLLGQINGLRASKGLAPLQLNGLLTNAAQNHSAYLATNTWTDPHREANGSTPRSRMLAAGYSGTYLGENVYGGQMATASIAYTWWLNSPVHYSGLVNVNYTEIGIGIASGPYGHFYTLDFGGGSGAAPPANPPANPTAAPAGGGGQPAASQPTAKPVRRLPTAIPTNTPGPSPIPSLTFTPIPTRAVLETPTPDGPTATPIPFDLEPQTVSATIPMAASVTPVQPTASPNLPSPTIPMAASVTPAPTLPGVQVAAAFTNTPGAPTLRPTAAYTVVADGSAALLGAAVPAAAQTPPTADSGSGLRALIPIAIGVQVILLAGVVLRKNRQ